MKRKLLLITCLLFAFVHIRANPIDADMAQKVAINFLLDKTQLKNSTKTLNLIYTEKK